MSIFAPKNRVSAPEMRFVGGEERRRHRAGHSGETALKNSKEQY